MNLGMSFLAQGSPIMLGVKGTNNFLDLLFNDFAVLALFALVLLLVLASVAKLYIGRGKAKSGKSTTTPTRRHRTGRKRRRRRHHRPSNPTLAETSGLPEKANEQGSVE